MSYEIWVTKRVEKEFDKFSPSVRDYIRDETLKLAETPYLGEQLKGTFRAFRSLHIKFSNVKYRVIYQVVEAQKLIYIHALGTRNNFYTKLERLSLKVR